MATEQVVAAASLSAELPWGETLLRPLPLGEFVLAGAGASALVEELGLCLLAAGFLSALFERLRIPTIAALLCRGRRAGAAWALG